jgi:GDP-4-dehydro-6-deoxy-D-mannose reductase
MGRVGENEVMSSVVAIPKLEGKQRLLVTGGGGFVGRHLIDLLAEDDGGMEYGVLPEHIDLRDSAALDAFCKSRNFDSVIHLAAQSFVPRSFEVPEETYAVNFLGTLNLLEALKKAGFNGIFLFVGSSEIYGLVGSGQLPITEEAPLAPRNPYAVSKAAAELLCWQWSITKEMRIVMARPFNHLGPGQDLRFAVSGFCRQIASIRMGKQAPIIVVGDLNVTRDFTDVRDVVRAYLALLDQGKSGEVYNICSGREVLLGEVLTQLREISRVDFEVEVDLARFRSVEQRRVCASVSKLEQATCWRPEIPLTQTLSDMYSWWLEKLKNE